MRSLDVNCLSRPSNVAPFGVLYGLLVRTLIRTTYQEGAALGLGM